ncbi:MAG TPA: anaerobic ribonucleoside-triphosphate reductase activating protein [Bacillota bacterium]
MGDFPQEGLIRLAGVERESVVDGPGLRGVVFFQGCPHQCPGCHNPETWDPGGGALRTVEEIWRMLRYNPLLSGITISGGEPLLQPAGALALAQKTREAGGNVMIYTGFLWEEIIKWNSPLINALLQETFLLVDGPFLEKEKDPALLFRGSRNQRLIDVQASLAGGAPVIWRK